MPETFRSQRAGTIADLMRQRGQVDAEAVRASGDATAQATLAGGQAWGNAIQNIGQTVSGTLKDYADYRGDAPNRLLRQRQSDRLAAELEALDTQQAQTKIGQLAQMVQASGYDPSTAEPIFTAIGRLSPDYSEPLQRALMDPTMLKSVTDALIQQTPGYKAPEGFTLGEGQTRFGPGGGEPIASVPKSTPPPQPYTLTPGSQRRGPNNEVLAEIPANAPTAPNPTEASLAMAAAAGDTNALKALNLLRAQRPAAGDNEPLLAVMGDDGNPVLMPRSQASGRRPASNREQGRAVTSGDAGELADFTTALDDIATVRGALSGNKATGTAAKAGAMLWNPITEATGIGTEAKQKQAVIDRVKQVIGKALEGGVLRKEDELKYAKILPTIGDTPEVVTSKLDGLEKAIQNRIQRKIDALDDAGYDVQKFRTRGASPKVDPVDALIKKYGGGQ
jgi:hypothetical protein